MRGEKKKGVFTEERKKEEKKMKRFMRARFILAALILLLAAGAPFLAATGKAEPVQGPVKLFTDKPGWQTGWDAIFKGFKAKTGLDVEMTGFTDLNTYIAGVKTGIASKEGPDVFTWWSNYKIADLAKVGLLEDLSGLFTPLKGKYSPGILNSFSYNGKIYGAPTLVAAWIMIYNKPVFEKYGLSEPKTWDDFLRICETLKSRGVTPVAFTIEGGWTSFFWFQQLLATNYPKAYADVCEGRQSWNSDEVKKTFLLWKELIDKGYFTDPGFSLGNELTPEFAKGNVAMTLCGDWLTASFDKAGLKGGTDYSIFAIPPQVKGRPKTVIYEAGPICISANAQHKQAARKFMEYWISDEAQKIWSETMNFVSPDADVPGTHLDAVKRKVASDVFGDKSAELIGRFWEATLETITLPACAQFDKFALKPADYQTVIESLDTLATDAWAKYKAQ